MKNLLKKFSKILVGLILASAWSSDAIAADDKNKRIDALDALPLIEMLNSVETGKTSELVQKFQNKEGTTRLLNGKFNRSSGCSVEALRNKEVLLVTIPASKLFGPNEITLLPTAGEYLAPFRRYLKDGDMYRVVIVMHTDNTGSEAYREEITNARADSVFNWFEKSGSDTRYLFPYALSDSMPIHSNASFDDRAANRRLEIYLIPGTKMIEQAKKGRIAF